MELGSRRGASAQSCSERRGARGPKTAQVMTSLTSEADWPDSNHCSAAATPRPGELELAQDSLLSVSVSPPVKWGPPR